MIIKDLKIAIIGAGPCGLTAAKNLLEQGLNKFTLFEKNDKPGGNWIFNESNAHSSIYETTHLISSKRLSSFEDFPMPDDYPDYPSHKQILRYFENYAEHFNLYPYLALRTEVISVRLCMGKKWVICYQNASGTHEEIFDYLMVANGHHWDPYLPEYPGSFDGEILHSHRYKKAAAFKDKKVLVVGGGNSACDIAVEIARIAGNTAISMRKGQHIFPKFILGKPTDIAFRYVNWLPFSLRQRLAKLFIRVLQGRYQKYQLKNPETLPLETHPTINSELLYSIRHGKISPRSGIKHFAGQSVVFTDGHEENFDTIIFATGYKTSFPFFDKHFLDFSTLIEVPLYKKMIHPNFESLFFIGLFQPQGCIWPLADFQAKIAAKMIKGSLKRPDNLDILIAKEINQGRKKYLANPRHSLEVDYPDFRKQLLKVLKKSRETV